jgi:hypothetical protein
MVHRSRITHHRHFVGVEYHEDQVIRPSRVFSQEQGTFPSADQVELEARVCASGHNAHCAFEALRAGKTVGKALSDTFAKGKNGTTRNERRFLLRTMVHEGLARVA